MDERKTNGLFPLADNALKSGKAKTEPTKHRIEEEQNGFSLIKMHLTSLNSSEGVFYEEGAYFSSFEWLY